MQFAPLLAPYAHAPYFAVGCLQAPSVLPVLLTVFTLGNRAPWLLQMELVFVLFWIPTFQMLALLPLSSVCQRFLVSLSFLYFCCFNFNLIFNLPLAITIIKSNVFTWLFSTISNFCFELLTSLLTNYFSSFGNIPWLTCSTLLVRCMYLFNVLILFEIAVNLRCLLLLPLRWDSAGMSDTLHGNTLFKCVFVCLLITELIALWSDMWTLWSELSHTCSLKFREAWFKISMIFNQLLWKFNTKLKRIFIF